MTTMNTTCTLTLSEDEAEVLGYALNHTRRQQEEFRFSAMRIGKPEIAEGCLDRIRRIEGVLLKLDRC